MVYVLHTKDFLVIGVFNTIKEAENYAKRTNTTDYEIQIASYFK